MSGWKNNNLTLNWNYSCTNWNYACINYNVNKLKEIYPPPSPILRMSPSIPSLFINIHKPCWKVHSEALLPRFSETLGVSPRGPYRVRTAFLFWKNCYIPSRCTWRPCLGTWRDAYAHEIWKSRFRTFQLCKSEDTILSWLNAGAVFLKTRPHRPGVY